VFVGSAIVARANQTIPLQTGYNFVGCQVTGVGANNINNPAFLLVPPSFSDPNGGTNAVMYVWKCSGSYSVYQYFTDADAATYFGISYGNGWYDTTGNLAIETWNPGEGLILQIFTAPTSIVLNGGPVTPTLPPPNYCGCGKFSLLSLQATNLIGTYENVTGFPPQTGGRVYLYDAGSPLGPPGPPSYTVDTNTCSGWTPSIPILTNSQAAFFYIPCPSNCLSFSCGHPKTVSCGTSWSFDDPTNIVDNCCTNYTITYTTVTNSSACPWVLTRIWIVTDCCGNTNSCSQTVTVVDTTPPTISCPPNKQVAAGEAWSFDTPTASDACCGTNVTINTVATLIGDSSAPCGITYTRVWQAVDCCSNLSSTCSQTVTVVPAACQAFNTGMTGPGGNLPVPAGNLDPNYILVSAPAGGGPDAVVAGVVPGYLMPDDSTSQWIAPAYDSSTSPQGFYDYQLSFAVCCTNYVLSGRIASAQGPAFVYLNYEYVALASSSWTPIYINSGFVAGINTLDIISTNYPGLFTGIRAELTNCSSGLDVSCRPDKTVFCGTVWLFDQPVAHSCCGSNLNITPLSLVTNNGCPQRITQTWLVTDACGNSNICSQTVSVVSMPIQSCSVDKTVMCGSDWSFDPPVPGTCCGSNSVITILSTVTNSGPCWLRLTRTWLATDCCTNAICSQTVTVVSPGASAADAAGDFSPTLNPNDVWSYGYSASLGSTLMLNSPVTDLGVNYWQGSFPGVYIIRFPWLAHNPSSALIGVVFPPHALVAHPGPSGQYSVLRYTAPAPCSYSVRAEFLGADPVGPTTTDVHVLLNSSPIFSGVVNGYSTGSGPTYGTTLSLIAGDTLDFAVGRGPDGDYYFDSTQLNIEVVGCCPSGQTMLQVNCPTNFTVDCGTPWDFTLPTATSCCGTNINIAVLSTITNTSLCPFTITRTWLISDDCGNTNTCNQTVTVNVPGPPVPPRIVRAYMDSTGFHIVVRTQPCYVYVVERQDIFTRPPTWVPIQTFIGDGTDETLTEPLPLPFMRFYRVRVLCPSL
jgi:hypothetical protein